MNGASAHSDVLWWVIEYSALNAVACNGTTMFDKGGFGL